ncbi:SU10 major capsid protein [Burkholderia guangdongensis]|uniref:SU10 major capsid protein n=1 Tax=Burkholderia guangdongensis TaxID=1792500 RepID=UPI0015CDA672|nr:DUF5309 family protein [Burkholderia guangdongensis]
MTANTMTTYQSVGNREDLIDKVFMISPTDTPFTSAIAKTGSKARFHEWQTDVLATPGPVALVEGADAVFVTQNPTTRLGNYTQIVGTSFSVSKSQEAVSHAGPNELARAQSKNMIQLTKAIEYAAILNTAVNVGSSTTARQMAGLAGWLKTNYFGGTGGSAPGLTGEYPGTAPTAGTGRAYTELLLQQAITQTYTEGGKVDYLLMTPNAKMVQNGFSGGVTRMQDINGDKNVTLNTTYTIYGSAFGNITIVPDRVIANATTSVFGVDTDMFALANLRGFETTELAVVGDSINYQIVWEGTLEARNEASSFNIADLNDV